MNEVAEEFFRLVRQEQETVAKTILAGVIERDVYQRMCGKYDIYDNLPELWRMAERAVMQRKTGDED